MRRSSSTTRRCGALSGSCAEASGAIPTSRPAAARRIGAVDQSQHAVALPGVEHRDQETPRHVVVAVTLAGERAADALALQAGEPECQRLAFGGDEQQPLPAVGGAFLLLHIALVDELLEHAAERLLGDLQDAEKLGHLHPGIAID